MSDEPHAPELAALRAELREIDGHLIALIGRRLRLSSRIGEAKRALGLPTRDYAQEKEVLDAAAAGGDRHAVPAPLAVEVVRRLIVASLTRQEQDRLAASAGGAGRRALVVGGSGRMGGWFVRFLASQGFRVEVADPVPCGLGVPWVADWREIETDHDLVVVAAPLAATAAILSELATRRPPGLVFDLGSIKQPLREGLARLAAAGVRVASVHPMFGPDTDLLSERHVIFVEAGHPGATREARALFDHTLAIQVEMTVEEHDRLVASVLGLSHAVNIAFAAALAAGDQPADALARVASTTYDAQAGVAARVVEENPALYFEIQALNRFGVGVLETLAGTVAALRDAVRGGDEAGFVRLMERGHAFFAAEVTR